MLKHIEVKRKKIELSEYIGRQASVKDYDLLIENPCIIHLEQNKPIVYINLDDPTYDYLIPNLNGLEFNLSNRKKTGKGNYSILGGAITPKINRSTFCNVGSLLDKDSDLHYAIIENISHDLDLYLEATLPQWHAVGKHFLSLSNIHPDYHMSNSIWTTTIINYNSPHCYHFDDANLKNVYSGMLTFKNDTSGGYLTFPEYSLALKTSNRSITFFYGRDILHGVSPITCHSSAAYRFTIVLYTLNELSKCQSLKIELNGH